MHKQEQHWINLFGHLTPSESNWHGIWTVYSPGKEVIKNFQGIRTLSANGDNTVVTHKNQFIFSDGTTLEKQWQIEKSSCNQPNGLLHPAEPSKRAFSLLGKGVNAWVPLKLEQKQSFGIELFLKSGDFNNSIGTAYGETGSLERIIHMREHLGSFPEREAPAIKNISGDWLGKKIYITSDLTVLPTEYDQKLELDPTQGKNETYFFNDSIVLNAPKAFKPGEEFEVIAGKLITTNLYQRLRAKYDKSGNFIMLISEEFCLK